MSVYKSRSYSSKHYKNRITLYLLFSFVLVTATLLATMPHMAQAEENNDPNAEAILREAWEKAQQSGIYEYDSLIEQTVYPVPSLGNAGRSPRVEMFGMGGQVDQPAGLMAMTIWPNGSFDPNAGVEVKIDGTQMFMRTPQGQWEEIENSSGMFAPGGDPLGFLAGL